MSHIKVPTSIGPIPVFEAQASFECAEPLKSDLRICIYRIKSAASPAPFNHGSGKALFVLHDWDLSKQPIGFLSRLQNVQTDSVAWTGHSFSGPNKGPGVELCENYSLSQAIQAVWQNAINVKVAVQKLHSSKFNKGGIITHSSGNDYVIVGSKVEPLNYKDSVAVSINKPITVNTSIHNDLMNILYNNSIISSEQATKSIKISYSI